MTLYSLSPKIGEKLSQMKDQFFMKTIILDFDGLYAALSNRAKNKRGIPDVDTLKAIYEEGDYYLQVANYDLNNDGVRITFSK